MSWAIKIPYRDRDDLVLEVIRAARESGMDEDERRVVEAIATDALERGVVKVGGLLDEFKSLGEPERRQRLDWARGKVGLLATGEIEDRREQRQDREALRRGRDPRPPGMGPATDLPSQGL